MTVSVDEIEATGRALWEPYLLARHAEVIDTNALSESETAQRDFGDYLVRDGARWLGWELKTERAWTGNLFLESYSNALPGPHERHGWMHTLKANFITFVFLDKRGAVTADFKKLQCWWRTSVAVGSTRYEVKTPRREQRNQTMGHIVPVTDVYKHVGLAAVRFDGSGNWREVSVGELVIDLVR